MGRQDITPELEPAAIRRFTKALLDDLRALERILAEGMIESGARRFGAEQEVFLVGQDWRPAPIATQVLAQLDDERFTTELALFNAEINLEPMRLGGECFSQLEQELTKLLGQIDAAARSVGGTVVMSGILPSLSKSDLSIENITPRPRYFALNEAVTRLRGGPLRLHIQGTDELNIEHDSVMLEACNTSFQVHFQVSADEFVRLYNVAQLIAAPVVAAAANSPLLFGKRLWKETRIALFQQSIDTRSASPHMREFSPRVRFGERWLKGSVVDAFEEDIARFTVLMAREVSESPFDVLADG
ncbi:MAG: glutamate-cysteine ligase family protein, partial [Gemmatimonadales bacterium]